MSLPKDTEVSDLTIPLIAIFQAVRLVRLVRSWLCKSKKRT